LIPIKIDMSRSISTITSSSIFITPTPTPAALPPPPPPIRAEESEFNTTSSFLEKHRLYFYSGFGVLGAAFLLGIVAFFYRGRRKKDVHLGQDEPEPKVGSFPQEHLDDGPILASLSQYEPHEVDPNVSHQSFVHSTALRRGSMDSSLSSRKFTSPGSPLPRLASTGEMDSVAQVGDDNNTKPEPSITNYEAKLLSSAFRSNLLGDADAHFPSMSETIASPPYVQSMNVESPLILDAIPVPHQSYENPK
jgi:hypothetical protein